MEAALGASPTGNQPTNAAATRDATKRRLGNRDAVSIRILEAFFISEPATLAPSCCVTPMDANPI
jgi:hypothetical protein